MGHFYLGMYAMNLNLGAFWCKSCTWGFGGLDWRLELVPLSKVTTKQGLLYLFPIYK